MEEKALFQNTYLAKNGGGWIALEEAVNGQIISHELQPGKTLTIGRGAFVASDSNVKVETKYAGVSGWWKGVGFAKLKASITDDKPGRVFLNSAYGVSKVIKISETDGPVIVDNNDLIAYSDELQISICKMGGFKSLLFSGEGSVNEFKGNGIIFVGSGESAARENYGEKIIKAICQSVVPDPVTLINRVTLLGLIYLVAYSPHLEAFGSHLKAAADAFANAKCCSSA